tara:strand:- start:39 stop:1220 length:1182 start_codon:yes stop_codon:yes gene_type:complete
MDNLSALDALLDSPKLSLTSKRRMVLLNRVTRQAVTTYFSGELKVVHVCLTDCSLSNVRFVLQHLFPKNPSLVLAVEDEKFMPYCNLGELVARVRASGPAYAIRLESADGTRRLKYATAYFLGHLLVEHCSACDPCVVPITNGHTARLGGHDDPGLYKRFTARGACDAERAILHATMLRTAEAIAHNPETWNYNLFLKDMGLNADSICSIAPIVHNTLKNHAITHVKLDNNFLYERGTAALFGKGVMWPSLEYLSLNHCNLGTRGCDHLLLSMKQGHMSKLEFFSMRCVDLDDEGACMLWDCMPMLPKLVNLNLSNNNFGLRAFRQLAEKASPLHPILAVLDLSDMHFVENCAISDKVFARAILAGHFPSLVNWRLPRNFKTTAFALGLPYPP